VSHNHFMSEAREDVVLNFVNSNPGASSKQIHQELNSVGSYATVKRLLNKLIDKNLLVSDGQGKGTKYSVSPVFELLRPVNIDRYFEKEVDERHIKTDFNFSLIPEVLDSQSVFSLPEIEKLNDLKLKYEQNIGQLTKREYLKELERLAIDLSWKSSQIEGNTYSLLETERLLLEKETASGKTKEEATMLLNHKEAIDFVVANPNYLNPISTSRIEDVHSILVKELPIDRNIRKRKVGISGTNYRPIDNEFQIMEALNDAFILINKKENVFEKALLALSLISYIQPFLDGNKRTARIVSNAILIDNGYCPISFRTVSSIDYKKAMLLFYEQNNITGIKQIFIDQFEFAVTTYF
jgi:Fic family protein